MGLSRTGEIVDLNVMQLKAKSTNCTLNLKLSNCKSKVKKVRSRANVPKSLSAGFYSHKKRKLIHSGPSSGRE